MASIAITKGQITRLLKKQGLRPSLRSPGVNQSQGLRLMAPGFQYVDDGSSRSSFFLTYYPGSMSTRIAPDHQRAKLHHMLDVLRSSAIDAKWTLHDTMIRVTLPQPSVLDVFTSLAQKFSEVHREDHLSMEASEASESPNGLIHLTLRSDRLPAYRDGLLFVKCHAGQFPVRVFLDEDICHALDRERPFDVETAPEIDLLFHQIWLSPTFQERLEQIRMAGIVDE